MFGGGGGGGATPTLPRDGSVKVELCGDPTVWPRLKVWTIELEIKDGRSNPKYGLPENLRCTKIQEMNGELDPAVDDHRRCKKNSPSVLTNIDKKTKEGCGHRIREILHAVSEARKSQFLLGNRGNLANEIFVKEISSPGGLSGVS